MTGRQADLLFDVHRHNALQSMRANDYKELAQATRAARRVSSSVAGRQQATTCPLLFSLQAPRSHFTSFHSSCFHSRASTARLHLANLLLLRQHESFVERLPGVLVLCGRLATSTANGNVSMSEMEGQEVQSSEEGTCPAHPTDLMATQPSTTFHTIVEYCSSVAGTPNARLSSSFWPLSPSLIPLEIRARLRAGHADRPFSISRHLRTSSTSSSALECISLDGPIRPNAIPSTCRHVQLDSGTRYQHADARSRGKRANE